MFITPAFAQTAGAAPAPSMISMLLPMVLVFGIMYFLLIRPQQKRLKEHRTMLSALRRGDMVVTAGGLVAKISKIGAEGDDEIELEIADGVRVKALRSTLSAVLKKTEPAVK